MNRLLAPTTVAALTLLAACPAPLTPNKVSGGCDWDRTHDRIVVSTCTSIERHNWRQRAQVWCGELGWRRGPWTNEDGVESIAFCPPWGPHGTHQDVVVAFDTDHPSY